MNKTYNIAFATEKEAIEKGYRPLTVAYRQSERGMLDNVIADMERGNIDYVLVGSQSKCAVMRR